MKELTLDSPAATASSTGLVAMSIDAIVLAVELIFGIRDSWVSARGMNGSITGGLVIGLFTLIPIASVVLCIALSRRRDRSRSSMLMRVGLVATAVGFPIALLLVIGAAY